MLEYKQFKRQFKIAGRSVDVLTGLLILVGVTCAVASGPWGWILVGAVALVAIATKLTLFIVQKVKAKSHPKPEALKASDKKWNLPGLKGIKQRLIGKKKRFASLPLDASSPTPRERFYGDKVPLTDRISIVTAENNHFFEGQAIFNLPSLK